MSLAEGVPGYLKYRVIEPNEGAVVVGDLFHLQQSVWTVRAMQVGLPGSSTLGDFTIKLPAPKSEDGKKYASQYALLQAGQKVEGFLGNVIGGMPRFTGVITKVDKPLSSEWTITGSDTLWWLQQSQLFTGESLGQVNDRSIPGHLVVQSLLGTRQVLWDDDFSTWGTGTHPNSTDYTTTGTWTATTDPIFGLPAMNSGATPGDLVENHTNFNSTSHYTINQVNGPAACSVIAEGVISVHNNNQASDAGEVGIYANQSGTNRILGRMIMRFSSTLPSGQSLYNIDAEILSQSGAGTFTSRSIVNNVFTNVLDTFIFRCELMIDNCLGVRFIINGKDSGVVWVPDVTILPSAGSIGVRTASLAPTVYNVWYTRLRFEARTSETYPSGGFWSQTGWGNDRFAKGTFTASAHNVPQPIQGSGQTYLDLMTLIASFDGYDIRKNPGYGYKSDSIDYGPNLGQYRATQIVFEEGVNIEENGTQIAPIADLFATNVRVNGVPGTDSGGSAVWSPLTPFYSVSDQAMVVSDTIVDIGIPGFGMLYQWAKILGNRKYQPSSALQLSVIRTPDTADQFREFDKVTVHVPTLGINYQVSQVIGYTFTEGDTRETLYLNQFPALSMIKAQLQRLQRPVEWLTNPGTYT